jgi:hypothetical protein
VSCDDNLVLATKHLNNDKYNNNNNNNNGARGSVVIKALC